MIDLTKAIISLYPNATWKLDGSEYSGFVWESDDIAKPTEAELIIECDRLQAEYAATQYKRLRAAAYPPIGDQLDALFHAGIFPAEMAAKLAEVKARFPK